MLVNVLGSVLLFTAPAAGKPSRAETIAAAGEANLKRAVDERSADAFWAAHRDFDNAYLVADDPRYLCRAFAVAELALGSPDIVTAEERSSWEDRRRDDLDRLREDAARTGRANCRFDASGKPAPPRVALINPDGPAPGEEEAPSAASVEARGSASEAGAGEAERAPGEAGKPASASPRPIGPEQARPTPARTAAGALLTSAGAGLLGGFVGVIAVEVQRAAELRGLIRTATAEGRRFSEAEDERARELVTDLRRGRDVAIGVGISGAASLAAGIAVLVTGRKKPAQKYAVQPYGGRHGGGAVLRLRF